MQILITGVAGFIGFNLSRTLLLKKKIKVYGIDNINNYYSRSLKLDRIKELNKFKNFNFKRIDLTNKENLKNFFKNKKFSVVINLAAQAGVKYSIKNLCPQRAINHIENKNPLFNYFLLKREAVAHMYENNWTYDTGLLCTWTDQQIPNTYSI